MTAKARLHLRQQQGSTMGEKSKAFNTLKGTSSQLLKSNLRSELSEVKGLALAFDVDKWKGETSLNL